MKIHICTHSKVKYFRISLATGAAWGMILLAILLRLLLIWFHYPVTMSDESVMDLMARHIAYHDARPLFFYGQAYMGPLEAYLGAFLFHLAGSSIFTVRLGLLLFYALFLCSMYALVRLLYTQALALFTLFLLILGNADLFDRQLKAIGGYPEMLFFGTLIFLLTSKLAFSLPRTLAQRTEQTPAQHWQRQGLYAALGFAAGFALYIDQLSITFVIPAFVMLLIFCRRELFSLQTLCGWLMFILGIAPLLYYNLSILGTSTPGTLHDIFAIQSDAAVQMARQQIPPINKLSGTLFVSLPSITGYAPLCSSNAIPGFGTSAMFSLPCTLFQGAWSLGYLILLLSALLFASRQIQRIRQTVRLSGLAQLYSWSSTLHAERDHQLVQQAARIMLLSNALLAILIYTTSASPATGPVTNSRYLLNTLITLPAMLWPLWHNAIAQDKLFFRAKRLAALLALIIIVLMLTTGMIMSLLALPYAQAQFERQERLTQRLLTIGANRIYTDYWNCYRLAFQSDERITCANLTGSLRLADRNSNRYPPYVQSVQRARTPSYMFSLQSQQYAAMQQFLAHMHVSYTIYRLDDFVVYQFATPIALPGR
jgi:4-amino-4-deoxy-L-arabinose transferase and related glycosyltransferases of PMT family